MCSIPGAAGNPGQVDRLGRAIDELAEAAQARGTGAHGDGAQGNGMRDDGAQDDGAQDMAAHLARVWEMVAELDPELARRLAGYSK